MRRLVSVSQLALLCRMAQDVLPWVGLPCRPSCALEAPAASEPSPGLKLTTLGKSRPCMDLSTCLALHFCQHPWLQAPAAAILATLCCTCLV